MPLDLSRLILDRASPVPLYFQVERLIELEIGAGRFAIGDRLPAEPDLADHFAVSRSVIRQALARLEQAGLLSRVRGHGTFVTARQPHSWPLQSSEGFFENEVGRLGRSVTSRVLRAAVEPLPLWAAQLLGLPPATPGVVLERLRFVDDRLTLYDLNYLPERFAEAVTALRDDPEGSLYEALKSRHDLSVAGGHRIIDAVVASATLAALLEVEPGVPLLLVEAVDLDDAHEPFDCYRTWVRPDRLKVEVRVVRTPTARRGAGQLTDGRGRG